MKNIFLLLLTSTLLTVAKESNAADGYYLKVVIESLDTSDTLKEINYYPIGTLFHVKMNEIIQPTVKTNRYCQYIGSATLQLYFKDSSENRSSTIQLKNKKVTIYYYTKLLEANINNDVIEDSILNKMPTVLNATTTPQQPAISIYPIPAIDYLIIDFNIEIVEYATVAIYDMSGKLMQTEIVDLATSSIRVELMDYLPGTYIITLSTASEQLSTQQIVIN